MFWISIRLNNSIQNHYKFQFHHRSSNFVFSNKFFQFQRIFFCEFIYHFLFTLQKKIDNLINAHELMIHVSLFFDEWLKILCLYIEKLHDILNFYLTQLNQTSHYFGIRFFSFKIQHSFSNQKIRFSDFPRNIWRGE